jgi:transposase
MKRYHYVGLDIHKKTISYCVKQADGKILEESVVRATPEGLSELCGGMRGRRWVVGMEATMFTGWVYDFIRPLVSEVKVGHPLMLRAIVAGKKKNDKIDARKLADLLRCDLFPECYMAPQRIRELRRVLRYRNMLVREATRMKNKCASLLMEVGAQYAKGRLHGKRYFAELLKRVDLPESVLGLLKVNRTSLEFFQERQQWLLEELSQRPELRERIERLMSIQGVGEVTALTWILEMGEVERFPSVKEAVSYCGLCGAQRESAGVAQRGPISKQRNKHLQRVLVEAAKLAPRYNPQLAAVHQRELDRGADPNRATLAVARKLVAYMLCVDKNERAFECRMAA